MTKVLGLSLGWSLLRDSATGYPWFERRGHRLHPAEFSAMSEARTIFREIKARLDEWDHTRLGDDQDFAALDKAKLGLQVALGKRGRWSNDLLETEVAMVDRGF